MYINQIQSAQTPGAGTADHLFTFALAKKWSDFSLSETQPPTD